MKLRVVFAGTPAFALPPLVALHGAHHVVGVMTQPDRPAGRGQKLAASPVCEWARGQALPVLQPLRLRGEHSQLPLVLETLREWQPEVIVVVAYGLILPRELLGLPRLGCLNIHASLLPRWRGAAPIQRAVMAGDARTGVMVMRMDEGLDTGPVGLVDEMAIGPDMTSGELHDRMMLVGADLMARALEALDRGSLHFTPQAEAGVTYAKKIEKAEARIDWSRPAAEVHNLIRGLSPFPGAFFTIKLGDAEVRVKALRSTLADGSGAPGTLIGDGLTIACGTGAVRLTQVQREGKGAMDAASFLRGAGPLPSAVL